MCKGFWVLFCFSRATGYTFTWAILILDITRFWVKPTALAIAFLTPSQIEAPVCFVLHYCLPLPSPFIAHFASLNLSQHIWPDMTSLFRFLPFSHNTPLLMDPRIHSCSHSKLAPEPVPETKNLDKSKKDEASASHSLQNGNHGSSK